MKIIYLESTQDDFLWFETYYLDIFPAGRTKAKQQFLATQSLLKDNPYVGIATGEGKARKLKISKTPFSYIYRVKDQHIEILRVLDDRKR